MGLGNSLVASQNSSPIVKVLTWGDHQYSNELLHYLARANTQYILETLLLGFFAHDADMVAAVSTAAEMSNRVLSSIYCVLALAK